MRQTIIADASQVAEWFQCHEKRHLEYGECLEPASEFDKSDKPMDAGSFGHKLLEIYYRGDCTQDAINNALAVEPPAALNLSTAMRDLVRNRFIHYYMTYCTRDITPLTKKKYTIKIGESGLPIDKWVDEPLVEQGFSYELLNTREYLFIVEGKVDLIGLIANSTMGFMDHKFQFREKQLYKKRVQFKTYAMATGLSMGIVNYIRLHKEVTSKTLQREIISFTPLEIKMWKQELTEVFVKMALEERTGVREKNRDSCEGKYGYECPYTKICEEPSLVVVQGIKDTYFRRKEEWKPW